MQIVGSFQCNSTHYVFTEVVDIIFVWFHRFRNFYLFAHDVMSRFLQYQQYKSLAEANNPNNLQLKKTNESMQVQLKYLQSSMIYWTYYLWIIKSSQKFFLPHCSFKLCTGNRLKSHNCLKQSVFTRLSFVVSKTGKLWRQDNFN